MPELVDDLEFSRGRPGRYGFAGFESDKTYVCKLGEDFEDLALFRAAAYSWGRNHGLRTRTQTLDDEKIAVRFETVAEGVPA